MYCVFCDKYLKKQDTAKDTMHKIPDTFHYFITFTVHFCLKNMVGPGEVDDDLEPEVKEECNTKYGDVNKVVIFELQNVAPEEAVRIFIEFKRVESAIKGKYHSVFLIHSANPSSRQVVITISHLLSVSVRS